MLLQHELSYIHVLWPPVTVIQHLERLFTHFIWVDTDIRRRIHWCRWPLVRFPVEEGGLGVWSFTDLAEDLELAKAVVSFSGSTFFMGFIYEC